jgi:hypothetical protein
MAKKIIERTVAAKKMTDQARETDLSNTRTILVAEKSVPARKIDVGQCPDSDFSWPTSLGGNS